MLNCWDHHVSVILHINNLTITTAPLTTGQVCARVTLCNLFKIGTKCPWPLSICYLCLVAIPTVSQPHLIKLGLGVLCLKFNQICSDNLVPCWTLIAIATKKKNYIMPNVSGLVLWSFYRDVLVSIVPCRRDLLK